VNTDRGPWIAYVTVSSYVAVVVNFYRGLASSQWLLVECSSPGLCRSIGDSCLGSLWYFLGLPPKPNGVQLGSLNQGLVGGAAIISRLFVDLPLYDFKTEYLSSSPQSMLPSRHGRLTAQAQLYEASSDPTVLQYGEAKP
jgi:hypothetical protein